MGTNKVAYYQFHKSMDYPVFIRIEDEDLTIKLQSTLEKLGFSSIDNETLKDVSFHKNQTKVLKISTANLKVARQIDQSHALDTYGPENLTMLGSYDVYRYKNVGMMMFGDGNYFWELGVKNIDKSLAEIQVMLTRFLSWALAPLGVIGFWGVPVEEGAVVMKPLEAQFESFFIDVKHTKILTQDGVKDISAGFQLLRLDSTLKDRIKRMKKEELVSFLSTNTSYFSYQGLDLNLKETIYEFSMMIDGYVYPIENFQPRHSVQES